MRGGYNKGADTQEDAEKDLTHRKLDEWTAEVRHWGTVDLLALATFPGGMPWFECCRGRYLKAGWMAR